MENTSIAQQRMSYCCHARFGRKVFTARCVATSTARIRREHCCYCCAFFWTCLLIRYLAMDVLLLLRANCGNVFTEPLPSIALTKYVTLFIIFTSVKPFVISTGNCSIQTSSRGFNLNNSQISGNQLLLYLESELDRTTICIKRCFH
jgi:hypothetical protein